MERVEFMSELAYNLSEQDCLRLFGVFKASLEDGTARWNEALEYAYQEFISEYELDEI